MRVLKRSGYGAKAKRSSAKNFRKISKRTKAPNLRSAPQRGGWRF